jgi:tRNA uridine 5-carbamoylmethylation protein Kti12
MIDGAGPGIGKSTLAEDLARALSERGVPVDLVTEHAIFERPEFAEAADGFRAKRYDVEREALPKAYAALVQRNAWVIFDWSAEDVRITSMRLVLTSAG